VPLALRAWLRYLVPLTLLAVIACAPLLYIALKTTPPKSLPTARMQLRVPWMLAGFAWIGYLWLVAAAAPLVRSIADANPLSQLAAFIAGLRGLVRGFFPVLAAVAAILLGGLALFIPGAILLCLLSLTGASPQIRDALPAALLDSVQAVRASWRRVALTLAAIVVAGLVIALAVRLAYVPNVVISKAPLQKIAPAIRTFVRFTGIGLFALAPLAACALAACYRSQRSR
jgi:hypothetical protein